MQKPIKKYLFLSLFILLIVIAGAQDIIVSVSDFNVESKNENYAYIGKGISTLVAGELRRTKTIKLLERSQMNKIMEEQKLSLSGMVDEAHQVELGKLMAADYIVFGEIIDMGNSLLVSVRMADVATTEVIWEDSLMEKLETYDYIGAYFAQSILTELKLDVGEETVAKVETKVVKETEAIVALSSGIDAYDKGDEEKAKQELKTVQMLDPESEVASYYLAKLVTNTTKFKVITTPFYSYQNPAYLGIMRTDRIHFNSSGALDALGAMITGGDDFSEISSDTKIREYDGNYSLGYYFPVGENIGLGFELFQSIIRNDAQKIGTEDWLGEGTFGQGGMVSFGANITDTISLGISSAIFGITNYHFLFAPSGYDVKRDDFGFSVLGGILYRNRADTLYFDVRGGYCSATFNVLDIDTFTYNEMARIPMVIEDTLTLSFNEKSTFFTIKNINDLGFDQNQYNIRLLPAAEHFFSTAFSVRGGLEGAMLLSGSSPKFGYGILSGLTYRFLKSGIEIDFNLTYRQQPSRSVEGFLFPTTLMLINVTFNDVFLSRE